MQVGVALSMIVARPFTSSSKKLSIGAFIGKYILFLCWHWFFQNLGKGWRVEAKKFVFVFISQKSDGKLTEFCRCLWIVITKIWIYINWMFYIKSQESKSNFLLIGMSFNHEKISVWNASIWIRGPLCSWGANMSKKLPELLVWIFILN